MKHMARWSEPTTRLDKILRSGRFSKIEKNQVIRTTEETEDFFLLTKGYVIRYMITNDGNIDVQSFYGPGYFFSLTTVIKGVFGEELYQSPETYYYGTLTNAEMYGIEMYKVAEAAEKDPMIYRELLMIAGRRLEANIQQIENRSLKTSYNRVAHQIAFFGEVFSDRKGDVAKLKIPLTQQNLADVLSTTRETVSLCMSDLKKKGLIKSGKFITVTSMAKLQEEAFN